MSKLLSSIYEVDGKSEVAVWVEGQETEALVFEVSPTGRIVRKGESEVHNGNNGALEKACGRLIPFKKK